ncbi:hypothetical protein D9M71_599850 [compost metagenome]
MLCVGSTPTNRSISSAATPALTTSKAPASQPFLKMFFICISLVDPENPNQGQTVFFSAWVSSTRTPERTTADAPLTGSLTEARISQTVFQVELDIVGKVTLLGAVASASEAWTHSGAAIATV